ncbi:hypothetical protein IG631_08819 [Alternaria alternata]|nr:hypothetical protein IG631_08819 [Alternaria alternata]
MPPTPNFSRAVSKRQNPLQAETPTAIAAERPSALKAAIEVWGNGSRLVARLEMMDDAGTRRCHIKKMRIPSATEWVSAAAVPQVPCMHW